MVMADIYSGYIQQRLIDVALGRRRSKRLDSSTVPEENITVIDTNSFRVRSDADPSIQYDVDISIGMCTCVKGETGAACKHQVACARMVGMVSLPQEILATPEKRRWLMCLAVGESEAPPQAFFSDIHVRTAPAAGEKQLPPEDQSNPSTSRQPTDPTWDDEEEFQGPVEGPSSGSDSGEEHPTPAAVAAYHEAFNKAIAAYGDGLTDEALARATHRLNTVKSSSDLNSLLHSAGPGAGCADRGGAGRGKIRVQPSSISRRAEGQVRGAARLGKGRRPDSLPGKPVKRRRCLAASVAANVANAKSHGAGH